MATGDRLRNRREREEECKSQLEYLTSVIPDLETRAAALSRYLKSPEQIIASLWMEADRRNAGREEYDWKMELVARHGSPDIQSRQWIVLTPDGCHIVVGHGDRADSNSVEKVKNDLEFAGQGGWLATADEGFFTYARSPRLVEVRRFGTPIGSFADARTSFRSRARVAMNQRINDTMGHHE